MLKIRLVTLAFSIVATVTALIGITPKTVHATNISLDCDAGVSCAIVEEAVVPGGRCDLLGQRAFVAIVFTRTATFDIHTCASTWDIDFTDALHQASESSDHGGSLFVYWLFNTPYGQTHGLRVHAYRSVFATPSVI